MFAMRAAKLFELYRAHDGLDAIPAADRAALEKTIFRAPLETIWDQTRAYFRDRDPAQIERAERDPKHKMALVFRWYLGQSSHWANAGEPSRAVDYQVWCGPAMAAFNEWVKGSFLEPPENRRVVTVALNILYGAAVLARARCLAGQGVALPPGDPAAGPAGARRDRGAGRARDRRPRHRDRRRRPRPTCGPAATPPARRPSPTPPTSNLHLRVGDAKRGRHLNPVDPTQPGPGGDHRNGLPVPQGRRPRRATGPTSATAATRSPTSPRPTGGPRTTSTPTPRPPTAPTPAAAGSSTPVDFPPLDFGIAPNNLDATDTTQLLGLMVARQALEDAGYGEGSAKPLDRDRVSVILGVTGTLELVIPLGARLGHPIWRRALKASGVARGAGRGGRPADRRLLRRLAGELVPRPARQRRRRPDRQPARPRRHQLRRSTPPAPARSAPSTSPSSSSPPAGATWRSPAGSIRSMTFSCTCASARPPRCRRRATPGRSTRACDGTILGEGLGVLALKRLDDARRDGDTVYAVIRSVGSSSDGKGNAVYAPKADGQARALAAGVPARPGSRPTTVELVEAHGTGTKVGDATELAALNEVYGEAQAGGDLVRPGLGQVADRPHQGGGRRGGPDQGGAGPAPQGLAADDQGDDARRRRRAGPVALLPEHRGPALAPPRRPPPPRGGQRLRVRRQQLPLRPRRGRARSSRRSTGTARRRSSPSRPTDRDGLLAALDAWPARPRLAGRPRPRPRGRGGVPRRATRTGSSWSPTARPTSPALFGKARAALDAANPAADRARAGGRLRRHGPGPGQAGDALPRPGVAVRRDAPRAGLRVPRRCRTPWPRPTPRRRRRPPPERPDLPVPGVHRRRARGARAGPAGDRGGAAGDRRGEPGPLPRPRALRRPARRRRRPQLRRADRALRGGPDRRRGVRRARPRARPADGRAGAAGGGAMLAVLAPLERGRRGAPRRGARPGRRQQERAAAVRALGPVGDDRARRRRRSSAGR